MIAMTRFRALLLAGGVGAAGGGCLLVAPQAVRAYAWADAADDPAALTSLGLTQSFDAARLARELEAALVADDIDLASSFVTLAGQQNLTPPEDRMHRYRDATTLAAQTKRRASEFVRGALDGSAETGAGLAGVIASDLTGVGDMRDLIGESRKLARGEEADPVVLGLASVGLALTGATLWSVGAALPVRTGASALRVAAKRGALSAPLRAELAVLTHEALDRSAVQSAASALGRFDLTAAKDSAAAALNPRAVAKLKSLATDYSTIAGASGIRGAGEALRIAGNSREMGRIARVAETRGPALRAVLKVLGRGAIAIGAGSVTVAGWLLAGASWIWFSMIVAAALARRFLALCWFSTRWSFRGCAFAVRRWRASHRSTPTPAAS